MKPRHHENCLRCHGNRGLILIASMVVLFAECIKYYQMALYTEPPKYFLVYRAKGPKCNRYQYAHMSVVLHGKYSSLKLSFILWKLDVGSRIFFHDEYGLHTAFFHSDIHKATFLFDWGVLWPHEICTWNFMITRLLQYILWFLPCVGGLVFQNPVSRAGTSNYIPQYLWDVITCPCPRYLLLPHQFSCALSWG